VIDAGEPRNRFAEHSHGFFGQDGRSPSAILDEARRQVLAYPSAKVIARRADHARAVSGGFEVRLDNGEAVPFVYNDHGSLINFSRYTTVGNLMGNLSGRSMYIEGKVARMFYLSLYRMHQVALHGMFRTGIIWLMDKISRAMQPRLKLH